MKQRLKNSFSHLLDYYFEDLKFSMGFYLGFSNFLVVSFSLLAAWGANWLEIEASAASSYEKIPHFYYIISLIFPVLAMHHQSDEKDPLTFKSIFSQMKWVGMYVVVILCGTILLLLYTSKNTAYSYQTNLLHVIGLWLVYLILFVAASRSIGEEIKIKVLLPLSFVLMIVMQGVINEIEYLGRYAFLSFIPDIFGSELGSLISVWIMAILGMTIVTPFLGRILYGAIKN